MGFSFDHNNFVANSASHLWSFQFCELNSYWSTGWREERRGPAISSAVLIVSGVLCVLALHPEVDGVISTRCLQSCCCIVNAMAASISYEGAKNKHERVQVYKRVATQVLGRTKLSAWRPRREGGLRRHATLRT